MGDKAFCVFCNKLTESPVRVRENGCTALQCSQCKLIYVHPRPDPGTVADIYGHDTAHVSAKWLVLSEFDKRLHARFTLNIIKNHADNGRLLEIGAGAGFFLDEARECGYTVSGLELNGRLAEYCKRYHGIECDVEFINETEESPRYDLIYHCDVLSHFPDPSKEFRAIHRRLRSGGLMVFETGNLGEMDPRYDKYIREWQLPDHLFLLTVDNIRSLLEQTGFEVLELRRFGLLPQYRYRRMIDRLRRSRNGPPVEVSAVNTVFQPNKDEVLPAPKSKAPPQSLIEHARRLLSRFYYSIPHKLRYGVGAWSAWAGTPQTVIVVAKKRE